jgi:hypothetical protein
MLQKQSRKMLSLSLTKRHAMKAYGRVEVLAPRIPNLSTRWGELHILPK